MSRSIVKNGRGSARITVPETLLTARQVAQCFQVSVARPGIFNDLEKAFRLIGHEVKETLQ